MNRLPLLAALVAAPAFGSTALDNLTQLEWEHRIILVHTYEAKSDVLPLLEQAKLDIDDRDIVWFVVKGDALTTNYAGEVSQQFTRQTIDEYFSETSGVLLVGKDGGVKHYQPKLELEVIFDKIDAMPMRRYEMGNRSI